MKKMYFQPDHIAIQVTDLPKAIHFFRDLLGFPVFFTTEYEGMKIVNLKAGKLQFEIWQGKDDRKPEVSMKPLSRYGVNHIAFRVKRLENVLERMKQAGVEVLIPPYEPTRGIREAVVRGPDGLEFQLVENHLPVLIWRMITGDLKMNRGGV